MTRARAAQWLGFALLFTACKGPQITPAPDNTSATLELAGINPCIVKVKVTISQNPGPLPETQEITLSGGGGTAVFRHRFNWDTTITFNAVVLEVRNDERCAVFSDLLLTFQGVLLPRVNHTYEVPPELIAQYRATTVAGAASDAGTTAVTVYGGKTRERFPVDGGAPIDQDRMILWAAPGSCRETCWEQWANYTVEWVQNDGPPRTHTRIFNGANDTYPQGPPPPRRLRFGRFERDLPDGPGQPGSPRESCFPDYTIPNVGAIGISDMPNQTARNPRDSAIRAFQWRAAVELLGLPNGPMPPDPRPFDLHLHFEMRSLLFCLNPAPRTLLGYFQWSADEDLHFSSVLPTAAYDPPAYRLSDPRWNLGATGLQAPPIVPR